MITCGPIVRSALLALLGSGIVACSNQAVPAKQQLDSATSAVSAAAPDAGKYLPDQYAALQARLSSLQAAYASKDYPTVLANAPAIASTAQQLATQAATRKTELQKQQAAQWAELSGSVPTQLHSVQQRLDALAKQRRAPKGVDLGSAKSNFTDANDAWTRAAAANTAGRVDEAVSAAQDASAKLSAAATALQLKLPPAASATGTATHP